MVSARSCHQLRCRSRPGRNVRSGQVELNVPDWSRLGLDTGAMDLDVDLRAAARTKILMEFGEPQSAVGQSRLGSGVQSDNASQGAVLVVLGRRPIDITAFAAAKHQATIAQSGNLDVF